MIMSTKSPQAPPPKVKRGRGRPKKVVSTAPTVFITGTEMARECGVNTVTLYKWVAEEYFPPQRCRPGACTRLWLRAHWDEFVSSGLWPEDAWKTLDER
ncbi:hypothetical protein V5E97_09890 [Singulisphaera sp. Ch08]|uniref:Helix-turn-helix domain-containing protein n=1 Tax=Singulisphaera sp. Ch08 TaxID=3120278 RepID=A0AAU7CMF6_9BACT